MNECWAFLLLSRLQNSIFVLSCENGDNFGSEPGGNFWPNMLIDLHSPRGHGIVELIILSMPPNLAALLTSHPRTAEHPWWTCFSSWLDFLWALTFQTPAKILGLCFRKATGHRFIDETLFNKVLVSLCAILWPIRERRMTNLRICGKSPKV